MNIVLVITAFLLLNGASALDWWERANFYQIYPRSFKDSNGDGVGDLNGIASKMTYFRQIGMTGVWLSPIFSSPMKDFGYDISNYTNVHGEYGTIADFENLAKICKALNIKLILDFVPNHTSNQHPWFIKSEQRDPYYENFYVWQPAKINETGGREPPNNWNSLFRFSAWEWSEIRQEYYLHQCIIEQPDLNYREPKVVQAMKDVLTFWLNKGVSGFRIDAIPYLFEEMNADGTFPDEPLSHTCNDTVGTCYLKHIYTMDQPETYDMVYQWRDLLDAYTKQHKTETKILMTEAYTSLKQNQLFYGDDSGRRGSQVPFNFQIIDNIKSSSTAADYKWAIDSWLDAMPKKPGYVANWVVGNHDQHRVVDRLGLNRGDLFNIMVQTLPGIAVTYNGEEIVMHDVYIPFNQTVDPLALNQGPENFYAVSRDPARTPFQWDETSFAGFTDGTKTWLPVSPDFRKNNVKVETIDPNSHLNIFKRLIMLRKKPALQLGDFTSIVQNDMLIYRRKYLNQQVFVVLNFGSNDRTVNLAETFFNVPGLIRPTITSQYSGLVAGFPIRSSQDITIPADGAAVFE